MDALQGVLVREIVAVVMGNGDADRLAVLIAVREEALPGLDT